MSALVDLDPGYPAPVLDEPETPPAAPTAPSPSRARRTQSAGGEPLADGHNGERVTVTSAVVCEPGSSPAEPLEAA